MQLYRMMTDVRAGTDHAGCATDQSGIATVWVRADSEADARRRGKEIIAGRNYASHGELQLYLEETPEDASFRSTEPTSETGQREGAVLSGYSEIKAAALDRGDGLFEAWFPA